ncbi:MAG: DUF3108 domain-containing protein [Alphaproteobacteria bacterium]|nr:DUF3108 domain-containing protein [Alphaproteobacteria bacterium]
MFRHWLCAIAAAWPSLALADDPTVLRLRYDAYIGGIRVLSIATEARYDAQAYSLEVAARTVGIVGWVGDWKGDSLTRGGVMGRALRPALHRADSTWRGAPRLVELSYGADGTVRTRVEPPPEQDNREKVPEAETKGTIDTLTAIVALVRRFGSDGQCAGDWKLFDGRRRFDVMVYDAGEAALEPSNYSAYAGPARKCRVTTRRVAGYWKGQADTAEQTGYVWMAPLGEGRAPVPVRAEAEIGLGTLVLNLRKAE